MKITYFLTTADLMGGTERALFTQARLLAGLGHDTRVLSVFKNREESFFAGDVPVQYVVDVSHGLPTPVREDHGYDDEQLERLGHAPSTLIDGPWERAFTALSDLELERVLGALDTDILVTSTPPLLALAIDLAPPSVVVVHEEHRPPEMRSEDLEPLELHAPHADAVVTLTERSAVWLQDLLGPRAPHLATVPNSIPHVFRPRADLDSKLVVAAGRFTHQKRFDHLIEAFKHVVKQRPDWRLRIYGDGPLNDAMRHQVTRLGLGANVELPGSVPDMTSEWAKGSIFAATSRTEGLPLVALEACAAGLPIVSYDCPTGPAEIIDNDRNGLLVPLADVGAMADALLRLIEDDELRHQLGQQAFESAERYSPETVGGTWNELFTRLISERDRDGENSTRLSRSARRFAERAVRDVDGRFVSPFAEKDDTKPVVPQAVRRIQPTVEREAREDVTVEGVRIDNARRVLEALDAQQVPHFLVPGYDPALTVIGVPEAMRERALEALRVAPSVHGGLISTVSDKQVPEYARKAEEPVPLGRRSDPVIRVFRPVTDPTVALVLGDKVGCDIEFWPVSDERPGVLVPPRHNRLVDALPLTQLDALPSTTVGGVRTRSLDGLAPRPRWDVIDFPIDVVYTWVDGADESWQARKAAAQSGVPGLHIEAAAPQRFISRDELKYSLRSLEQNAPWVRHVYVVTDAQTPDWLDASNDRITVVDHRDIFTDTTHLPTFNSHAIESQLHHIDGLSEHFLYFNDDVMIGRPVAPDNFFLGNGLPRFFPSPVKLNFDDEAPPHIAAGRRTRELLERDFGRTTAQGVLHTPYPMRRSILEELEKRYADEFRVTAAAQFRGSGDVSVPTSLFPHYAFLTGRAVPEFEVDYTYVNLGRSDVTETMIKLLRRRDQDVIAIGDPMSSVWSVEEQHAMAHSFLTEYFPVPSRFER